MQESRHRRRLFGDRGSTLPELAIAMLVLSVGVLGVVGSMGLSMQLVGGSRQQSSGMAVATERLERIHDIPYEGIALYEQPTFEGDPEHPDHHVSADSSTYTLEDGTSEAIVYDPIEGALPHIDETTTVGNTEFSVYQYVTAGPDVDVPADGVEDSRRVTVVVVWKNPVGRGAAGRAAQSTLITPGTIALPTPSPTPAATAAAPTATPANCMGGLGGLEAGTMDIVSGSGVQQGFTKSTSVQVTLDPADGSPTDRAELSNGAGFLTAVVWDPLQVDGFGELIPATVSWTIPTGDGPKVIEARFRGTADECSDSLTGTITLDQTPPDPAPSGLVVAVCTLSAHDRDVTVTWMASSVDVNLLGHRLYRSIDNAPFEAISTVASIFASDVTAKNNNSVRYLVRTYDKAGNESGDSNTLSFSKNSC